MANRLDERAGWPEENISLLLKACIATDGAYEAWLQWLRRRNIDDINWAELRLLAAFANRIQSIDPDSPEKPRLEGIRRFVWTKNQIRLDRSMQVIDLLQNANIPVMLLKGMARIATNPSLAACRFVRDIDILVPSNYLVSACDTLIANGWRPVNGVLPGLSRAEPFARIFPLANAEKPEEDEFHVDIHRSVIHYGRTGTFDDIFWERCREGDIRGRIVRVPSETDQFLHAIAHATISDPERPVDWVIDAMDTAKGVDWHLLAAELDRRRAGAAVAYTLAFLEQCMGLHVPPAVKKIIRRDRLNPVFRLEVMVYWRLPENRIKYGGVIRDIAEWLRSRHCRYQPQEQIKTLWTGTLINRQKKSSLNGVVCSGSVTRLMLNKPVSDSHRFVIDIEIKKENVSEFYFDILLENTWIGRLHLQIPDKITKEHYIISRFTVEGYSRKANSLDSESAKRKIALVLVDESGKLLTDTPREMRIVIFRQEHFGKTCMITN